MSKKPLTPADRSYAKAQTRLALTGAVGHFFEKLAADGDITQAELARRLGVSRSRISKILSSPGNWTVDTIGEILAGMDARVANVTIKKLAEITKPNEFSHHLPVDPLTRSSAIPSGNQVTLNSVTTAVSSSNVAIRP